MAQSINIFIVGLKTATLISLTHIYHDEHTLRNIKSMSPVVIGHSAVVLSYSEQPAAQNLNGQKNIV